MSQPMQSAAVLPVSCHSWGMESILPTLPHALKDAKIRGLTQNIRKAALHAARVVLLLDYDGTLSPICDDPSQAYPEPGLIPVLRACASPQAKEAGVRVVIISGRSVNKIKNFLAPVGTHALNNLIIAGSHGYDIQCADGTGDLQPFKHLLPVLGRARESLTRRLASTYPPIAGASVEDNVYSISLHYRLASMDRRGEVERIIRDTVEQVNAQMQREDTEMAAPLEVRPGKMVWEMRPCVSWGKGHAVMHILREVLGVVPTSLAQASQTHAEGAGEDRHGIVPSTLSSLPLLLCLGDDATDEDMFRAVNALEEARVAHTATILITQPLQDEAGNHMAAHADMVEQSARMPRFTAARWWLRNPHETRDFLAFIISGLIEGTDPRQKINTADVNPTLPDSVSYFRSSSENVDRQ